jgi:hypothetical protein
MSDHYKDYKEIVILDKLESEKPSKKNWLSEVLLDYEMLGINPSRGRLKEILYVVKHWLLHEDMKAIERLSTSHLRLLFAAISKSRIHGCEPLIRYSKVVLTSRKLSRVDMVSLIYFMSKIKFQDGELLSYLVNEISSRHLNFLNYIELRILVIGVIGLRDKSIKLEFASYLFNPVDGIIKDLTSLDHSKLSKLSLKKAENERRIGNATMKTSDLEIKQN